MGFFGWLFNLRNGCLGSRIASLMTSNVLVMALLRLTRLETDVATRAFLVSPGLVSWAIAAQADLLYDQFLQSSFNFFIKQFPCTCHRTSNYLSLQFTPALDSVAAVSLNEFISLAFSRAGEGQSRSKMGRRKIRPFQPTAGRKIQPIGLLGNSHHGQNPIGQRVTSDEIRSIFHVPKRMGHVA